MSLAESLEDIVGREGLEESAHFPGLPVVAPADDESARELFLFAQAESKSLRLFGRGSKLGWSPTPKQIDFALSTHRLQGVIEFEAEDGTLTARAGSTMGSLRDLVAERGLELSPDVPRPHGATLGGVLAAGASGPDRLRHGPGRLHILGTRALLPGGEITKSGGRLVKNVTGYDLHRLYAGSHGSLALVLEASLRLFNAPRERCALRFERECLDEALGLAEKISNMTLAPRTLTLFHSGSESSWSVDVGLAGLGAELERKRGRLAQFARPDERLDGAAALTRSEELRDREPHAGSSAVLHLASLPSRLADACEALLASFEGRALGKITIQPGVALADLALAPDGGTTEDLARRLQAARTALTPLGARLSLRGSPQLAPNAQNDCIGGPALALMKRLKEAYDPTRILASNGPVGAH